VPEASPMAIRRSRRAVVVFAASERASDRPARELAASLEGMGIETSYLGYVQDARRIASVAAEEQADSIEVCLVGGGGVLLLRELLRELTGVGRRDVSIVVHKSDSVSRWVDRVNVGGTGGVEAPSTGGTVARSW
jgi:methylmalonyl-CoA mutase cobalamin-binding domain/chain